MTWVPRQVSARHGQAFVELNESAFASSSALCTAGFHLDTSLPRFCFVFFSWYFLFFCRCPARLLPWANSHRGSRFKSLERGDMAPFPYMPMVAILASLVSYLIVQMSVFAYAGYMVEYLGAVDDKNKAGETSNTLNDTTLSLLYLCCRAASITGDQSFNRTCRTHKNLPGTWYIFHHLFLATIFGPTINSNWW